MHRRHDAQRKHVVDSLDDLIFQLYAVSFFMSPDLVPLVCRVASQFVFYKPRELDPKLSLRVWFLLLCAANAPSFWSHLRDGATQGRAVVLDFVGMGHLSSKLHLVLLDAFILCLQMLLTTISFEISLRSSSSTASTAIPSPSAASAPTLEVDCEDDDGDGRKHLAPTLIIDLRSRHLINHLRNPTPLVPRVDPDSLPLPNTTPSPLSMHLRAILRRRTEEMRRRAPDHSDAADTVDNTRTEGVERIPGSMSIE